MQTQVRAVVSKVLGIPEDTVTADSSPETVEAWDSLKHMNLVLALEEEFGIRFPDETIVSMLSVGLIEAAVTQLLPQSSRDSER
jgi:acyl carrier protein